MVAFAREARLSNRRTFFDPGTIAEPGAAAAGPAPAESPPRTYEVLRRLATGGMGEVERVHDPVLDRTLVRKVLLPGLSDPAHVARFVAEAELTARLEHPGIVPVHDVGRLPDGRPFFVMKEVRGATLDAMVGAVPPRELPRRNVDAVLRVAEAVAFAHEAGVVHRDIKPANIMVGDFGEVVLLDWGVALARGAGPQVGGAPSRRVVVGTPGFMAPEQAEGNVAGTGPWSDVYALGAVLGFVLTGRIVRAGASKPAFVAVELWEIVQRALALDPGARFSNGAAFAAALSAWRDGDVRRARAMERVAAARVRLGALQQQRQRASEQAHAAATRLAALKSWEPVEKKREAWALEDEAKACARDAELEEVAVVQLLGAAIADAPELDDAHRLLAGLYRARHEEAEAARDPYAAARWEALLRAHDRGEHAAWLSGRGTVSVHADAPGASATVARIVERERRLEPVEPREVWPIQDLELEAGSWLVTIRAPGRAEVRYPVLVERGRHWDGMPPGEDSPLPIPLPAVDELGPDDVYVPPGPCWIGGTNARNALPRQRVWVDGFVIRRHPVTNREFMAFLDDLVVQGRVEEAETHQPLYDGPQDWRARVVYGRDAEGRFVLVPDPEGDLWDLDWPVVCVSWHGAVSYTRWLAERTGKPWRLPSEIEREKAGRGADGRAYPWGDHPEPTWSQNAERAPGRAKPGRVQDCPTDESVYGVRGLAGNVRDWCLEARGEGAGWVQAGRLIVPGRVESGIDIWRATLGGAWSSGIQLGQLPQRLWAPTSFRNVLFGFRPVRGVDLMGQRT